MSRRNALAATIVLLLVAGAAMARARAPQTPSRERDAATIRAHIESIFRAFIDKDAKKLAATHGRNWRGYLGYSQSVIKGRDGYMEASIGTGPMEPKGQGMVDYKIVEYDTVFYGDVAVVNFVADVNYKWGDESRATKLTLMDVYAKEDGDWIQVASQTSYHPDYQDARMSNSARLGDEEKASLLAAREAVWRAWYGGDTKALSQLLPPELITMHPDSADFGTYDSIVAGSERFAKGGGKLTRLTFPRTEYQRYGNTVIIYTTYELGIDTGGKVNTERGKATEVFVRRGGKWLNTGWQLAPER